MRSKTKHHRWKQTLFVGMAFLLTLPALQQIFAPVKLEPLQGAFEPAAKPEPLVSHWFDGSWQAQTENYIEDHIGFRELFVRIFNQYHYSVFHHARARQVIIGKKNYLYELNYIRAYTGADFIGDAAIAAKAAQLRTIQDSLAARDKHLLVLLAPGKGSYYPEFIPDEYLRESTKPEANYKGYRKALLEAGVHLFDAKKWFEQMRDTSRFPLFPRTGIHWSKYGELLVADSLLRLAGGMLERQVSTIEIARITTSRNMRDTDDDIEKGMNLWFDLPDLEMAYPEFSIRIDTSTYRPKVHTIADSYYWGMYNFGLSRDAFNPGVFWFYNEQVYTAESLEPVPAAKVDLRTAVDEAELFILISTDANLYRFPFGFADDLHSVLTEE